MIAAILSIVLALFTIWQAWLFYRASSESLQDARRVADEVGACVRRLEDLVDHLRSDAFGLVRDTVEDMRRHIWLLPGQAENRSISDADPTGVCDAICDQLIRTIAQARRRGLTVVRAEDLLGPLFQEHRAEDVHNGLALLRREGVVDWDGEDDWVEDADVPISLSPLTPQRWRLKAA